MQDVPPRPSRVSAMSHRLVALPAFAQVIEGESEIVNLRETDGRLGFLIIVLIVLGVSAIIGTGVFWWLTRPTQRQR